jgi:hypothetical protein
MVRIWTYVLVGAMTLAGSIVASEAAPMSAGPAMNSGTPSSIVEVDNRCGPHAHYVRRHRNHAGHWVSGHCVHG